MGTTVSPLDVDRLYGGCHRHLHRVGPGEAYRLGKLLTATTAGLADVYRAVLVRPAVCGEVARPTRIRSLRTRVGPMKSPAAAADNGRAFTKRDCLVYFQKDVPGPSS